jgi:hypothetical protein
MRYEIKRTTRHNVTVYQKENSIGIFLTGKEKQGKREEAARDSIYPLQLFPLQLFKLHK